MSETTQTVTVFEAGPEYADALAHVGTATYSAFFGPDMTAAQLAEIISDWFDAAAVRRAMATDTYLAAQTAKGDVVGFVRIGKPKLFETDVVAGPEDQGINAIYVLDSHQNSGVGRKLLEAAFAHPRLQAAPAHYLDVWEENTRAVHLYESLGFKLVGVCLIKADGEVVGEDLVMRRENPDFPRSA